jgi:hypothetical protein
MTVEEYVASVPSERKAAFEAVLAVVRQNLPQGYEEALAWGMLSWQAPLSVYPKTYNKKPLLYISLANQKSYLVLYMLGVYGDPVLRERLESGFKAAGKKLDMGKSCLHFKKLEDLPLELIGELVGAVPMEAYVEAAKRQTAGPRSRKK